VPLGSACHSCISCTGVHRFPPWLGFDSPRLHCNERARPIGLALSRVTGSGAAFSAPLRSHPIEPAPHRPKARSRPHERAAAPTHPVGHPHRQSRAHAGIDRASHPPMPHPLPHAAPIRHPHPWGLSPCKRAGARSPRSAEREPGPAGPPRAICRGRGRCRGRGLGRWRRGGRRLSCGGGGACGRGAPLGLSGGRERRDGDDECERAHDVPPVPGRRPGPSHPQTLPGRSVLM